MNTGYGTNSSINFNFTPSYGSIYNGFFGGSTQQTVFKRAPRRRNEEVEVDANDSAKIDEFLGGFAVKK